MVGLADASVTYPSDEALELGLHNPTLIFQNVTIFYALIESASPAPDTSSTTSGPSETTPLSVPIATSHTKRPSTVHWQLAMEILPSSSRLQLAALVFGLLEQSGRSLCQPVQVPLTVEISESAGCDPGWGKVLAEPSGVSEKP